MVALYILSFTENFYFYRAFIFILEQNFCFTCSRKISFFILARQFYYFFILVQQLQICTCAEFLSITLPLFSLQNKNKEISHTRLARSKRNKIVYPLCYKNILNKTCVNNEDLETKGGNKRERDPRT